MSTQISEYTDYLEYIVPWLPSCPERLILQQLRLAGRDFCINTEAYIIKIQDIDVVEDQTEYDMDYDADALIQRVLNVEYNGSDLDYSDYEITEDSLLTLQFTPQADIDEGIDVTVVLRPRIGHTGLDAWFLERHYEGIVAKAKFELMTMPNKPWSNPQQAGLEKQKFETAAANADWEVMKDFKNETPTLNLTTFQ